MAYPNTIDYFFGHLDMPKDLFDMILEYYIDHRYLPYLEQWCADRYIKGGKAYWHHDGYISVVHICPQYSYPGTKLTHELDSQSFDLQIIDWASNNAELADHVTLFDRTDVFFNIAVMIERDSEPKFFLDRSWVSEMCLDYYNIERQGDNSETVEIDTVKMLLHYVKLSRYVDSPQDTKDYIDKLRKISDVFDS